ncbi:MAG: hypothetical protein DWQ05_21385 [Calditrichaeota bacterium]|nr:MAG: hypothetical protein DWQ05_21385 [Calditrichota bacterium]
MNNKVKTGILFFVISLQLSAMALSAQTEKPVLRVRPEVDAIFNQGVILYNNGNFHGAKRQFERILGKDRWHQRLTSTLIMYSKTLTQLGHPDLAEESIRQLLLYFPKSRYLENARFQMGIIHYLRNNYVTSAKQFLWTTDFAKSPILRQRGAQNARIVINDYLSLSEIRKLRAETAGSQGLAMVISAEAMQYFQQGNKDAGVELVRNFIEQNPQAARSKDIQNVLSGQVKRPTGRQKLGIILPLSGQFADKGKGILRGLKYAQQKHIERYPEAPEIEVIIRDSESNIIKSIHQIQELESDPDILCVVGEVENFITAAMAGVAESKGLPLVAPVASDNGIAGIGPHIFQANPNLETQARALARYAVDSLGHRTFVTVAPQDEYGHQMVDAFSEEVDRLGAEIITQRWYYGIPEKLGGQFKEIREIAFRRMLEDSLRRVLPDYANLNNDSLWTEYNNFVMLENSLKEDIVESSGFFRVENVNAAYFPVYDEDIEYVARQFTYFNINAQILGSENWYFAKSSKNKKLASYVDKAIFASSYFYDPEKLAFRLFRNEFRKAMGVTPEKMELLGYDTGLLIFGVFAKGTNTREATRNEIMAIHGLQGRKGIINIDEFSRVNKNVNILQFQENEVVKLPNEAD